MEKNAPLQRQSDLDSALRIPARGGSTKIRIFNGLSRRTADWDGLRKDSQLWSDDADCLVHFYAYGTSARGPSLKVPYETINGLDCSYLRDRLVRSRSEGEQFSTTPNADTPASPSDSTTAVYSLHIPSPPHLPREEAFAYHLTTRNVIAYAVGKPVVGERLSTALIGLWERLQAWLPGKASHSEFVTYLLQQGYLNLTENAEHALACLKFAEAVRFNDVWVNAFAHCAGMHERLDLSPEFAGVSKTTVALLTRASLEMDLHISRVLKALGGFLEEELGPEFLGLSKAARDHLDHFRSFLHAYYVDRWGWFPPRQRNTWNKRPWREMYHDFQHLYEFLVDTESTRDWMSSRVVTGGICVGQNIQAFDERHGYEPLPHPLPLLPSLPSLKRRTSIPSQTTLRNLKLGRTNSIPESKLTTSQALAIATNKLASGAEQPQMMQEYQRFERQKLDSKLDILEARKVRWLLIYSVLQMLTSIMKGPKEVRDAESASYPVCVLTSGCPTFSDTDAAAQILPEPTPTALLVPDALDALEGRSSRISIHPDCEADSAEDYFASTAIARQASALSLNQLSSQNNRPPVGLARSASKRASMQFSVLQKSLVGSLNRKSSRRASMPAPPREKPLYCEIVVEDYGNGIVIDEEAEFSRPLTAVRSDGALVVKQDDQFQGFDFDFGSTTSEPVLEHSQLELQTTGLEQSTQYTHPSPSDSRFSNNSIEPLDSNRSSYLQDNDTTDTDLSSWDDEDYKHDSASSSVYKSGDSSDTESESVALRKEQLCYQPKKRGNLGISSVCWSVSAGCYSPTGLILPPKSKFTLNRTSSSGTDGSDASSVYPEGSVQAADIEEVDIRGRQRSRAMDGFARHSRFSRGTTTY